MSIRTMQLLIVVASCVLVLVGTDILLPSLPHITEDLHIAASNAKMLISIFMVGQFTTVLVWGIIADRIGRGRTLFIGMLIFLIGSLLSLSADSIRLLLFSRFIQGAGGVVVPVAGWALIQDLYPSDAGARIMTWVGTITAVIPLFAPAIGGKLDVLYGWQSSFYCIAGYSLALSVMMACLPKQPHASPAQNTSIKSQLNTYMGIIRNRTFISYISLFGLLNCGEWCFLTVAPFYYSHVHITPDQMGLLLMTTSMGFVLGSLLATKLFKQFGIDKTIAIGIQLAIVSCLVLLGGVYFHWSNNQLFCAIDLSVYNMSSAILWGATTSRALQCFDHCRGSASAVRSLILLCFASFGTYIGRLVDHQTLYSVGFFLLIMAIITWFVFNNQELRANRLVEES